MTAWGWWGLRRVFGSFLKLNLFLRLASPQIFLLKSIFGMATGQFIDVLGELHLESITQNRDLNYLTVLVTQNHPLAQPAQTKGTRSRTKTCFHMLHDDMVEVVTIST